MMSQTVSIEAKNSLARLLATENLRILHQKMQTAMFDTVNRILYFPIWKQMSSAMYTMLAAHEVGHALYTYELGEDGIQVRVPLYDIAKRIDKKHYKIAASYLNIICDARIERLIKNQYPGLRIQFITAYKELYDRNFFQTNQRDIQGRCLIDRINLYFKVSSHVNLTFTPQEQIWADKVANTLTFADVIELTKEIYNWCRANEQPEPLEIPQFGQGDPKPGEADDDDGEDLGRETQYVESEDGEEAGMPSSKPAATDDPDGEDGEEVLSKRPKASDKAGKDSGDSDKGDEKKSSDGDKDGNKTDKPKDGDGSGKDGEGDDKGDKGKPADANSGKNGKEETDGKDLKGKTPGTGKQATKPVPPGPPPMPETQQIFDESIKEFNDDKAMPIVYITLPKPNLENILVDFTTVHNDIQQYLLVKAHGLKLDDANKDQHPLIVAEREFAEFRTANKDKVNYIYTQFERKKQADKYKRTRTHKTGSLDVLRLHAYKFEDDIFKTIAIATEGKNHALIFVVDWSSSMSRHMASTIKQAILLALFCRKANIPFEVYSLTTGERYSKPSFDKVPGSLDYTQNFKMRNYLSSRMKTQEFQQACLNLFALMPGGTFCGGPTKDNLIGCTPLDESIVATMELMKRFRRKTGGQVMNATFLTDGAANTVNEYLDLSGNSVKMTDKVKYYIDDREYHKHYECKKHEMTPTVLKILRDRQNINATGFFIANGTHTSYSNFFRSDDTQRAKLKKEWDENGYVISTEWGYNELYIINGERLNIKNVTIATADAGKAGFVGEATKDFAKQTLAVRKGRVMLDRFVTMIA